MSQSLDIFSNQNYYCKKCSFSIIKDIVNEDDKKIHVLKCMNRRCEAFNVLYLEPVVTVKKYIPQSKKPDTTNKVATKKKL